MSSLFSTPVSEDRSLPNLASVSVSALMYEQYAGGGIDRYYYKCISIVRGHLQRLASTNVHIQMVTFSGILDRNA